MSKVLTAFLLVAVSALNLHADEGTEILNVLKGIKFEGLYYLSYQAGQKSYASEDYNQFLIKRGYLTMKKQINSYISSRITLDTYQDETRDMKVRLKYIYADFKFPDFGFITKPHAEFGLVHTPWLDFEEHVNYYRMQDTMFMERIGLFNSADFGFTAMGFLGGEVDKEYQDKVNNKYPGRYGSFALGLYNGGGYHAKENNQNKVFQERVTIRPVPDVIPGLQISELFITGKGNGSGSTDDINDWQTLAGMLSYERQYVTMTAQYLGGKGRNKGDWSDQVDYNGYSVFAEGKLGRNWRIIGRYDFFDPNVDEDNDGSSRIIAGCGYDFGHHNVLLLDYDVVTYENSDIENDTRVQLTMQVDF